MTTERNYSEPNFLWKPSGTLQEAELFASQSKIKDTFYCGTLLEDYYNMVENGWDFDKAKTENYTNGRGRGRAVYLYTDERDACDWAKDVGYKPERPGAVLSVKINVINPAFPTMKEVIWMELSNLEKNLADKLRDLGHDAAVVYGLSAKYGQEVMVLDPKKVMIVKEATYTP